MERFNSPAPVIPQGNVRSGYLVRDIRQQPPLRQQMIVGTADLSNDQSQIQTSPVLAASYALRAPVPGRPREHHARLGDRQFAAFSADLDVTCHLENPFFPQDFHNLGEQERTPPVLHPPVIPADQEQMPLLLPLTEVM